MYSFDDSLIPIINDGIALTTRGTSIILLDSLTGTVYDISPLMMMVINAITGNNTIAQLRIDLQNTPITHDDWNSRYMDDLHCILYRLSQMKIIHFKATSTPYRILLINPPYEYSTSRYGQGFIKILPAPPLGLGYVGSYLLAKQNNINVDIVDYVVKDLRPEDTNWILDEFNPDVVGISINMAYSLHSALKIIEIIKRHNPDVKIVVGGAHATFDYEALLNCNSGIDCIARFEGERVFNEIVGSYRQGIGIEDIDGIAYRCGNQIICNADMPRLPDLDDAPIFRELLNLHLYPASSKGIVMTSRGCPYNCAFCSTQEFNRNSDGLRCHSAERVSMEIGELVKIYKVNNLIFGDDTFTINRMRLDKIICSVKDNSLKFAFGCDTRLDLIDDKIISDLKSIGLKKVFFGFESLNSKALQNINKKAVFTESLLKEKISLVKKHGLQFMASFIIGLPYDTKEDFISSVKIFVEEHKPDEILLNFLTAYPGTSISKYPHKYGISSMCNDWRLTERSYPMVATEDMSPIDMIDAYIELVHFLSGADKEESSA